MKLVIDREALKRKILEDGSDGEVEAGMLVTPGLLADIMKRHMAASDPVESSGEADEGKAPKNTP